MKKTFPILLLIFFFSGINVISQTIGLRLQTKYEKNPISGALNFIIDKSDSTVLGFGVSDETGYSRIILSQAPKNHLVQLKVFSMGYSPYTVFDIYCSDNKITRLDLEMDPGKNQTELFTVLTNKTGSYHANPNRLLDSIPLVYYQQYLDIAEYYDSLSTAAEEKYQADLIHYKKQMAEFDSLSKLGHDVEYLWLEMPESPPLYTKFEYLDPSPNKNQPVSIDGGWEIFYDYFTSNQKFQHELKRNGKLRVWLSTDTGYKPYLDTVVVCVENKKCIKGLKRLCHQILERKLKINPVLLGSNLVVLEDNMSFYIDFIYREE